MRYFGYIEVIAYDIREARRRTTDMSTMQATTWLHSNRYSADKACEHCEGVIRHEPWCITRSPLIHYSYQAVLDAASLSMGDHIILHALGVQWIESICAGECKSEPAAA